MNKGGIKVLKRIIALLLAIIAWPAAAAWHLNMPRGVTPTSKDIYDLHMTIFWICVAIGVVVFSVMIYALIYHRKSRGAVASKFHEHPGLEIIWAVIPFVILVIMAIPATRVLIAMDDTADADVTVKITGYQWKWQYEYLDQGISFFSILSTPPDQYQLHGNGKFDKWYLLEVDNKLVLPVNRKIRFLVTANDVIHSWWVPDLGVKRDALPGFIGEAWARIDKPGIYRGQCAELCGNGHGYMPIVVEAVSEAKFDQWVAKKLAAKRKAEAAEVRQWTKGELMQLGKATYDKVCAVCHKVDGTGQPPTFPPIKASSVSVGKPISRHIDMVLNGVKGSAMQAFKDQLNDDELAAVITYERNAFGNNTGDLVQPATVKDQRAGKIAKQPEEKPKQNNNKPEQQGKAKPATEVKQ